MILIFKIIAFEQVAGESLYWKENICDRPLTWENDILRFLI